MNYELLASGDGRKWERFGSFILDRPCPQAVWPVDQKIEAHATFSRKEKEGWIGSLPQKGWILSGKELRFHLRPTEFGHIGLFPEHQLFWNKLQQEIQPEDTFLNLFAYSGAATLFGAQKGAKVCHVDAAQGMVDWAKANAALNGLTQAPIRWIVDDALKFVKREVNRGRFYDWILLDPPSFGRGAKGEVFKIERDIVPLLQGCKKLLTPRGRLLFSCHTPGWTPTVLLQLLNSFFEQKFQSEEMFLKGSSHYIIPCGSAAWTI